MRNEIKSASDFLSDLLRIGNTMNEQQLDLFRVRLEDLLRVHYDQHWFPERPTRGSAYRCLRINHKMDPLIANAARAIGIDDSSLLRNMLPHELTLWIDPREVAYRIGENGSICVLYDGAAATTTTTNGSSSAANNNAIGGSNHNGCTVDRYSSCKGSYHRGMNNAIRDSRNMNLDQFATCVSS